MPDRSIGAILQLQPVFDAKTWGGRRLADLGKQLPPGAIGESLETSDDSVIVGGRFDGQTLGDLVRSHPEALLGVAARSSADGRFPLLIKFIDAHETLSVQVHPDDSNAPAGKRGKTEAWCILDAQPGAELIIGLEGELDLERLEQQLVRTPVAPGDVFFVPAGTVHAIGAGVLLYEVQQPSDVTYRLYDWGRPREIHVDEARKSAKAGQAALRTTPLRRDQQRELLVASSYFILERWTIDDNSLTFNTHQLPLAISVLSGKLLLDGVALDAGATLVAPADLGAGTVSGSGIALVARPWHRTLEIRRQLSELGHSSTDIERIGDLP